MVMSVDCLGNEGDERVSSHRNALVVQVDPDVGEYNQIHTGV